VEAFSFLALIINLLSKQLDKVRMQYCLIYYQNIISILKNIKIHYCQKYMGCFQFKLQEYQRLLLFYNKILFSEWRSKAYNSRNMI